MYNSCHHYAGGFDLSFQQFRANFSIRLPSIRETSICLSFLHYKPFYLSLSLSLVHTHTHTHILIVIYDVVLDIDCHITYPPYLTRGILFDCFLSCRHLLLYLWRILTSLLVSVENLFTLKSRTMRLSSINF